MQLVIGNKNYSSWSLRPWLLLRAFNIPFDEIQLQLYTPGSAAAIRKYSPTGKVPALVDGNVTIWDSLAICEYIAEKLPRNAAWPENPLTRGIARSYCAEMHSGFQALRNQMPMNCRATGRRVVQTPELQKDIKRIDQLWSEARHAHENQGAWLFGRFSIADCMYAPVVFRFNTYGVQLSDAASGYRDNALAHPAMQEWANAAIAETAMVAESEIGLP